MPRPNNPRLPGFPALRDAIDASDFTIEAVAAEAGFRGPTFFRYLDGTRTAPDGFEVKARAALTRLQRDHAVALAAVRAARQGGGPDGDAA